MGVNARKIVVGMDASPEAAAAMEWARMYAAADDVIVAVHAWREHDWIWSPYMVTAPKSEVDEVEAQAKERFEHLMGSIGDERVTAMLAHGRPGEVVAAEGSDADVVVVGHRGDGQVSMMLGSTADHVVHHATVPVVVVRGRRVDGFAHVVVGVDADAAGDDGDESLAGLRWALSLPGVRRIEVVHAWSMATLAQGMYGIPIDPSEMDDSARAVADKAIAAIGEVPDGVEVVPRIGSAGAAGTLIDASEEADLVVVGSRGRGGFAGLLLGSTSIQVVAHSHAPVAVVRGAR